jgi:hypothetical protein
MAAPVKIDPGSAISPLGPSPMIENMWLAHMQGLICVHLRHLRITPARLRHIPATIQNALIFMQITNYGCNL